MALNVLGASYYVWSNQHKPAKRKRLFIMHNLGKGKVNVYNLAETGFQKIRGAGSLEPQAEPPS